MITYPFASNANIVHFEGCFAINRRRRTTIYWTWKTISISRIQIIVSNQLNITRTREHTE